MPLAARFRPINRFIAIAVPALIAATGISGETPQKRRGVAVDYPRDAAARPPW